MEGEQVHCGVCGEEVKTAPSNQENRETSPLLQNYFKGISSHFHEEINFGDLEGLIACDGCSLKINSLQIRKEWFEGLRKEVSEAERNLHRKLTDMNAVGLKLLDQTKELEKLIMHRIQKGDLNLGQVELFLQKGTEKDTVALKGTLTELKEKLNYVKKRTGEVDAENGAGTSSSSDQVACKVLSVTSLAVIDQKIEGFEVGEVFQVKTEQEESNEEDDNASTGVPVPECLIKVEEEEIRTTRHRVIYGSKKVAKIPFEALPNKMLQTASNQEAAEYEVIDLEDEEAEQKASTQVEMSNLLKTVEDIPDEIDERISANFKNKKRSIVEVENETEVEVEEPRQKIARVSSPGSRVWKNKKAKADNKTSNAIFTENHELLRPSAHLGGGTSQQEAEAESSMAVASKKRQMRENTEESVPHVNEASDKSYKNGNPSKAGKNSFVEVESASNADKMKPSQNNPSKHTTSSKKNSVAKPVRKGVARKVASRTTANEESEKWFTGFMSDLNNSVGVSVERLRLRIRYIPKLSSDQFHNLVIKMKEENKLEAFKYGRVGYSYGPDPNSTMHKIIKNVEIEQRTLKILFKAGVDFNALNNQEQNVLFAAMEGKRSISFVTSLVKRGINVNQVDCNGESLLFFAVGKGCSQEILEVLIREGAELKASEKNSYHTLVPNTFDLIGKKQNRQCLFKALVNSGNDDQGKWALRNFIIVGNKRKSSAEFLDVIQFIFSYKDTLGWFDTEDKNGVTILHLALSKYEIDQEAFEMLVKAKCNFKKVDKKGQGTLYYALRGGQNIWLFQKLIEQGADVTLLTTSGANLLHSAAYLLKNVSLKTETFEFLHNNGVDITALDSDGSTVLETACRFNISWKSKTLTNLIIWSFDAGLRHLNKAGVSIVEYTAERGTPAALDYILERSSNVDINKLDENGISLFEKVICGSNNKAVENSRVLIKYGADVQLCKGQRETALHHLSLKIKLPAALKVCLEELRQDVNATDKDGMTPLLTLLHENFCLRVRKSNYSGGTFKTELEKVKIFLENGANVNAKPNTYFLLDNAQRLQTHLDIALYVHLNLRRSHSFELVKLLVLNGANVNEPNLDGWTAIHFVMATENLDLETLNKLTTLFGDKVDYSAKTHYGDTALHLAAKQRNINSIRMCLEKGVNVNDMDKGGDTALDYYLFQYFGQNIKTAENLLPGIKLLLGKGASSETMQKVKKELEARWKEKRLKFDGSLYRELLVLF